MVGLEDGREDGETVFDVQGDVEIVSIDSCYFLFLVAFVSYLFLIQLKEKDDLKG